MSNEEVIEELDFRKKILHYTIIFPGTTILIIGKRVYLISYIPLSPCTVGHPNFSNFEKISSSVFLEYKFLRLTCKRNTHTINIIYNGNGKHLVLSSSPLTAVDLLYAYKDRKTF